MAASFTIQSQHNTWSVDIEKPVIADGECFVGRSIATTTPPAFPAGLGSCMAFSLDFRLQASGLPTTHSSRNALDAPRWRTKGFHIL